MTKYKVTLTADEREQLLRMATRGKGAASAIRRANILLAVDRGEAAGLCMSDEQAAAAYHATTETVRVVRKTFVERGLEAALARKRRSRPGNVKLDGEAEAKIVALTCTDPPAGHARWTLRLIAQRSVELGYVESISHVAIGNLLKKTSSSHGWSKNRASPRPPASS